MRARILPALALAALASACASSAPPAPASPAKAPAPDVLDGPIPPAAGYPDDEGDEVAAVDLPTRACRVLFKAGCAEAARLVTDEYPQGETCIHFLRRKRYVLDVECVAKSEASRSALMRCHVCRK